MTSQVLLTSISLDDLKTVISESVSNELQKFRPQDPVPQDDQLIKVADVAKLLNVSKMTVIFWKKSGKLPFYRISNKIYFKKNEVIEALKKIEEEVVMSIPRQQFTGPSLRYGIIPIRYMQARSDRQGWL